MPISDARFAPESTIMDETHKVAVTRLGDRIRVGGTAELTGYSLKLREARRATLNHVASDLFQKGGDVSQASFWCGLRPMTPDGTPIVGPTPLLFKGDDFAHTDIQAALERAAGGTPQPPLSRMTTCQG